MGTKYSHKLVLQAKYKKCGIHAKVGMAAKDLGIGRAGGARRTMIGIKDRFGKARFRANKVAYLLRKNKKAKALYGTGVVPTATYGIKAVGYKPSMVKQLRTMAADSMGCAKYGRCPITAIAIAKGPEWDPEVRGPTRLIMEWCRLVPQVSPETLVNAWAKMEHHLEGGNIWKGATSGPRSLAE